MKKATIFIFLPFLVFLGEMKQANARDMFMVDWDPVNTYTDGTPAIITEYRLYYSRTSGNSGNLLWGDASKTVVPASRTSACVNFTFDKELYVSATAVDNLGTESALSPAAYLLKGNVYDRYDPFKLNLATGKVDIADLQTLRQYWATSVTHPYYDCSTDFTLLSESDQQASDINRDGRVDFLDLVEVGLAYGNTTHY